MWFIQTWTSRIMSSVVLISILASQIAFIYTEYRVNFTVRGGRRKGKQTLYVESKNTNVSFQMAALLNVGIRALHCICV